MSTTFPTDLQGFTNPTSSDSLNTPGVLHTEQHANINDTVEALQAKIGINGSADTSSLDYKISQKQNTLIAGTNITIVGDTISAAGGSGSGDVVGPASSTDGNVVLFNGVDGKAIKDSGLTLSGTNTGDNAVNSSSMPAQPTTIELGHASDTTLSRVSAGVMAVEGVTVPTISSTNRLTNKIIDTKITSAASYTTDTGTSLDVSVCNMFIVTAQAGALKFNNPTGTPTEGQKLMIRIKDNGTARALTYDTQFRALGTALPSTTVLSKTLYMGFVFNITDTKRDLICAAQE